MALEDYEFGARYCSRDSICKFIPQYAVKDARFAQCCPSISRYNVHAYSGGGRVIMATSLLQGRGEISEEVKEIIYKCQLCGACQTSCHIVTELVEPLEIARELKFRCVEEGKENQALSSVRERLVKTNNIFGKKQADRGKWAEGLKVKDAGAEAAEVLFFAGCRLSYDDSFAPVARKSVELMSGAGMDVGILGKGETCCGGRLFDMGYREDFRKLASTIAKKIKACGAKRLVTACGCCYGTFKQFFPMMELDLEGVELLHISEVLDDLMGEGKIELKREIPLRVTYHDPCHLGRLGEPYERWEGQYVKKLGLWVAEPDREVRRGLGGVFDPPRNVIAGIEGIKLVEMKRKREYAWCCGAGGGVLEAYPEFAAWTAGERLQEAMSEGCEALVTACPWCETAFRMAVKESGVGELKVMDLVDLVAMAT